MGSFAYAETRNTDNSINLSADLSGGDLSSGAQKNIISGGDVNVDGMSEDLANTIFSGVDRLYGNALNFVQSAVGTQQQNTQQATTALQNAYNSTQASINNFKTYALYATIGFIAWAYFRGK